ncbi:MAG: M14 family zinc carboxypeptidase, partial [Planctomycetota bacterium]
MGTPVLLGGVGVVGAALTLRRTALSCCFGVLWALGAGAARTTYAGDGIVEEYELPAFDHEDAEASYVVARPADWDGEEALPLILDLHGAIHPSRKGANLTVNRLWARFVEEVPCVVAAPNCRTRGWNRVQGEKDDRAYVLEVLERVREKWAIDPKRIYLAGFSSGSDYACTGGLQADGPFAGTLVVCPGPPNVVGIRNGALERVKAHPFLFAAGEEDYIRKSGAFEAYLHLQGLDGRTLYREVPEKGHEFFGLQEYVRLFADLERLAGTVPPGDPWLLAQEAGERGDYLLAETFARRASEAGVAEAKALLDELTALAKERLDTAFAVDAEAEPGRAYEALWAVWTQFHAFSDEADAAREALDAIEGRVPGRDLYRARRAFFESRSSTGGSAPPRGGGGAPPPAPPGPPALQGEGFFAFDRYLTFDEIAAALRRLAARRPDRARLLEIGRSVEGRPILALEVTNRGIGEADRKPAVYVQGGLHGNEISSTTAVLYAAWRLTVNPRESRGTDRILERATVIFVPALNPDGVHHYLAEPHSRWRPRFNYRPHDSDGDGRVDEDSYEDLDGDGEIGLMYRPAEDGPFVLEDGRLVRGEGDPRWEVVGREGLDDDGDGRFSEDPVGGVDLNRNFPVGFSSRNRFEGSSGPEAASEPETQAVIDFLTARPNVTLFFDVHNDGRCLFYWLGPERGPDAPLYDAFAERCESQLGYP